MNKWEEYLFAISSFCRQERNHHWCEPSCWRNCCRLFDITFFLVVNLSHKQNVSLYEGPCKKCSSLTHVTYHITDFTVFFDNSLVLLTLFLGDGIWKWALLPAYHRNMLHSSA